MTEREIGISAMFHVPIRLGRGQNDRECRGARIRRVAQERHLVRLGWPRMLFQPLCAPPAHLVGCCVTVTRIAPGELDSHDNLRAACKGVVDEVALLLGVDDGDPRLTWLYDQQPGEWGVRVSVQARFSAPEVVEVPSRPRQPRQPLLARAQATAGFTARPAYIPPRRPK